MLLAGLEAREPGAHHDLVAVLRELGGAAGGVACSGLELRHGLGPGPCTHHARGTHVGAGAGCEQGKRGQRRRQAIGSHDVFSWLVVDAVILVAPSTALLATHDA